MEPTAETNGVKIISITASGDTVFGLGEDNRVYKWNTAKQTWEIFSGYV